MGKLFYWEERVKQPYCVWWLQGVFKTSIIKSGSAIFGCCTSDKYII